MYRPVFFLYDKAAQWQYDENGTIVRPCGRDFMELLSSKIAPMVESVSTIEEHSFYGWAIATRFHGCSFYQVLCPNTDEIAFTIKLDWYFIKTMLLQRPKIRFEAYCDVVSSVLNGIPGVSNIRWFEYAH